MMHKTLRMNKNTLQVACLHRVFFFYQEFFFPFLHSGTNNCRQIYMVNTNFIYTKSILFIC